MSHEYNIGTGKLKGLSAYCFEIWYFYFIIFIPSSEKKKKYIEDWNVNLFYIVSINSAADLEPIYTLTMIEIVTMNIVISCYIKVLFTNCN